MNKAFITTAFCAANLVAIYAQNQNLNWTLINDGNLVTPTSQFVTIGSDGDGQHLVLANSDTIIISDDFGLSWVESASNEATETGGWVDVAVSTNGQYVTLVSSNGVMIFSGDFGQTYPGSYALESPTAGQFVSVDMSDDGMYQYAVTNNGTLVFINGTGTRTETTTTDAPVDSPAVWSMISTSGDGSKVYASVDYSVHAGQPLVYYSYDYAKTWTATDNSSDFTDWVAMECSTSGQYVAAIDRNNVYVSTNYGVSYTITYASGQLNTFLTGIDMSSKGKYVSVSISGGGILVSSQYGVIGSWDSSASAPVTIGVNDTDVLYGQIVSNDDGSVQNVVTNGPQGVYTTYKVPVDYINNLNWTQFNQGDLVNPTSAYDTLGSDGLGQHLVLANDNSVVYSADYGANWATSTISSLYGNWTHVAMSKSGQFVTIVGEVIAFSNNYGQTFFENVTAAGDAPQFASCDMSDDGTYQYAVTKGGLLIKAVVTGGAPIIETTYDAPVASPAQWAAITTSGDGSYVFAAVASNPDNGALVFYSYDYAATWQPSIDTSEYFNWVGMTCSTSGQYVVGINRNNVYLSTDYGITYAVSFQSGVLNSFVYGIAMDTTGQYQAISNYGGGILVSSNFGTLESWEDASAPLVAPGDDIDPILYGQIVSNSYGNVLTVVTSGQQGVYTTYAGDLTPSDDDSSDSLFTSTPFIAGVAAGGGALLIAGVVGYMYFAKVGCFAAKEGLLQQSLV